MTDAEIVALERVLKIARGELLDSVWPRPMERALAAHAIETVQTFLETRGYGVPTFEPGEVAYLPDAKELESFRIERDAEAESFDRLSWLDWLEAEDAEAVAVELADKVARRAAFNGAA